MGRALRPTAAGTGRTPLTASQSAAAFFQGSPHLLDLMGRPIAPTSMAFALPFFLPPLGHEPAPATNSPPMARGGAGGKSPSRSPPQLGTLGGAASAHGALGSQKNSDEFPKFALL